MSSPRHILFLLLPFLAPADSYVKAQETLIIPRPRSISREKGTLPINDLRSIIIADDAFLTQASYLLNEVLAPAQPVVILRAKEKTAKCIFIRLAPTLEEEEYVLTVCPDAITIQASNPHGCFNAIQTLRQLISRERTIPHCTIADKPAFPIRGYMLDVARNYVSLPLIKQQIDAMGHYKMNVLHMHLTEDIAWRIQSDLFPSLHAATNMLRDKGKYYTFAELNELAAYCRGRGIAFIPEIDMPGHSDAFKRAIGYDMQTAEGKKILYQLLDEFFSNVQTDYFHIGGDEVAYRDKNFLKEISAFIRSKGKKIIAWDPGGETDAEVIKQLWNGRKSPPSDRPSIDSRHLYLNHFDPLEGVVAIFNHSMLDTATGGNYPLGGILCNWPDRRVGKEEDVINMNAVYPSMIAFSERAWCGGGFNVFDANMEGPGSDRYAAFSSFERKLIEHKKRYFNGLSFPYQKQSDIEWKMIGPFANNGDVNALFAPEMPGYFDTFQRKGHPSVWGGTIWLRHFWDPVIKSHFNNLDDSTTWYAYRKIYADAAGSYPFWIGFNNISRSHKASTPPLGAWDDKGSKVWVNGALVTPPSWKFAGRVPKDLEEPLFDEGYEYRAPTSIYLNKGWNKVLLKLPVRSFQSPTEIPVKWMFTFVQVLDQ